MLHVQLSTSRHDALQSSWLERREIVGHRLDLFKEGLVANEAYFHSFDDAMTAFALWKRVQESEIIDHGKRDRKGADPVLLALEVNTILHSHTAISLAECGGRKPDMPNAAVRCGGRKADEVQNCASTDDKDVRMAIQCGLVDLLPAPIDDSEVIFAIFAPRHREDVACELQHLRMSLCIAAYFSSKSGIRRFHSIIDKDQHFRYALATLLGQQITDDAAAGSKDLPAKHDAVCVSQVDRMLGHWG